MRRIIYYLPLCLTVLLAVGCTTRITNLTASKQARNQAGLYPVSVVWDSAQQSIRKETLKAFVQVGLNTFPMQSTPLVKDRWETLIPVPADQERVNYRFKFDYEYLSMPHRRKNSNLSPSYQLRIEEK